MIGAVGSLFHRASTRSITPRSRASNARLPCAGSGCGRRLKRRPAKGGHMGTSLNPYLSFRGNARDAMEFYKEVFGGTLTISTFGESHASTDASEDGLVMHADLEGPNGLRLMGADAPKSMEFHPGNNLSLSLSGESEVELRGYFDKLSAGGSETMPHREGSVGRHLRDVHRQVRHSVAGQRQRSEGGWRFVGARPCGGAGAPPRRRSPRSGPRRPDRPRRALRSRTLA